MWSNEDTWESETVVNTGQSAARFVSTVPIGNRDWMCNVVGTQMDPGNWAAFWDKHSGKPWPEKCRFKDCSNNATDGGHMYLRGKSQDFNFIVPICSTHNNPRGNHNYRGPKETNWQPSKSTVAVKIHQHPDVFSSNAFSSSRSIKTAKPESPRAHVSPSKPAGATAGTCRQTKKDGFVCGQPASSGDCGRHRSASPPPRAATPPRMAATAGTCRQIKKDGFVCGLPAKSGDCGRHRRK